MDTTAMEQYLEETCSQNDYSGEDKTKLKRNSFSDAATDSDASGFDCNICLDLVQDPVVTLCGHLYCWPCIYKWLHFQSISTQNQDHLQQQQCPVCKAEVSQDTLVPLFGQGQTESTKSSKSKAPNLGIIIPRRPLVCGFDSPRSPPAASSPRRSHRVYDRNPHPSQQYYAELVTSPASPSLSPGGTTTNVFNLMVRELIHTRIFGNSMSNMVTNPNSYHLAATPSPRVRRHVMQADRSLSRIWFFLFCCAFLCFLLF